MHDTDRKPTFSNRREWASFLRTLQDAATYPRVLEAVKSSRAWLTQGAAQASHWLSCGEDMGESVTPRPL